MKSMIFMCISLVIMAGIARVYMAGGLGGLIDMGSGKTQLKVPENVKAVTTDRDVEVYKWRDEKGVMHFGESPPQINSDVEKIELKTNTNVMKSVKLAEEKAVDSGSEIKQVSVDNPYSPQGVSDLMNQTKDLANSLNKQQADQKKMMDSMIEH